VVSFTPWPLDPWGSRPLCPLRRRLGGPQSRYGQEKNLASTGWFMSAIAKHIDPDKYLLDVCAQWASLKSIFSRVMKSRKLRGTRDCSW
jgi:hypothetical protein